MNNQSSFIRALSVLMLTLCFCMPALAQDETGDEPQPVTFTQTVNGQSLFFTVTSEDDKTVSVKGTGASTTIGALDIPESVTHEGEVYAVTSMPDYAFTNYSNITEVTIPKTIASMGIMCFNGCANLETVHYNTNLISAHKAASQATFGGTSKLNNFYFGDEVTTIPPYMMISPGPLENIYWNHVTNIGFAAFNGNPNMKELHLPEGLQGIGDWALTGCTAITEITIPSTVSFYGAAPTRGCTNLRKVTWLTNKVTSTKLSSQAAFLYNRNITDVVFGPEVTRVPNNLFYTCPSPLNHIEWNNVTEIGSYAFYSSGVTALSLSNQIAKIGNNAFQACRNITSLVLPTGLETIGSGAFQQDSKLSSITFPDKYFTMWNNAFYGVGTDESVTTLEINIPDQGIAIPGNCFRNSGITQLVLPASVRDIANAAFANCDKLQEVYAYGEQEAPIAIGGSFGGATYDAETGEQLTQSTYEHAHLYVECIRLNGEWRKFKTISARPRAAKEYTTFARNYQVEADNTQYKCYVATNYDLENNVVTIKQYDKLPSGAGAILWKAAPADADDYLLTGRTTEGDAANMSDLADGDTNFLIGVVNDTSIAPQETVGGTTYTNFLLSNGAYYRFDNAGTLAAGKSYLHLPISDYSGSVTAVEARPLTLQIVDRDEAVVETRLADAATADQLGLGNAPYYTLQGVRVATPVRGGIYIRNGKKVIVK